MAPLKTYSRLNDTNRMKFSIYNSLGEPTFKKRKRGRKKIVIPDLPPPSTVCQLSDNSLKVAKEDSFDRLLKTSNHNSIHFKYMSVSSSDSSCNFGRCTSLKTKNPIIGVINYEHSTVSKKNVKTLQKNETTYSVLNREKSTGTSIESSLEIEVVRKAKPLIDSSLGLINSSISLQKSINISTIFDPVLCKSFQSVPAMCSTPIEPENKKFINQTLSPITTNNFVDNLVLSKCVSNAHDRSDAVTPTSKPKPEGISKPLNVVISGGKTNPRTSYITTRKRKIYFTPVTLLTNPRFPRLTGDVSNNSNYTNNNPSNLEQNQRTDYEKSKAHCLCDEDIIQNSPDDGDRSEKKSLVKSILFVDKTEHQIETPVYITLRNRKVKNSISKSACKSLNFGNLDTFERWNTTQSVYKDVTKNNKTNNSSSIFSNESSCNVDSSSKTEITNVAKDQQNESSSACYESTNLEGSHNSYLPVQKDRFEEVSSSIMSVNTIENTTANNFCNNTHSNVENAVSMVECEENSTSLMPTNSSSLLHNNNEETHDLDSIEQGSFKFETSNLQPSTFLVYGESMCESNLEKEFNVNVRRSKRSSPYSQMITSNEPLNSENNLENGYSANKETVSPFQEPQNLCNSEASVLSPLEVIVNIERSSTIEDVEKNNFNLEVLNVTDNNNVENSLDDRNQQGSATRLSASIAELKESSRYSTHNSANKTGVSHFEGFEDGSASSKPSAMPPLEAIVNINRNDTIENIVNSQGLNEISTDTEMSLDDAEEQGSSTRSSASILKLQKNNQYSTSLSSPTNKKSVTHFEELENVTSINSGNSVKLPMEATINIKRTDTVEDRIKHNFIVEDLSDTDSDSDVKNNFDVANEQKPSTTSVIDLDESSEYSMSLNSDVSPKLTPEIKGNNVERHVPINSSNLEEDEEASLLTDSFKSLHLNNENEQEPSSVVEVKENSNLFNLIPIVKIKRSDTIEKLLKGQSTVEKETTEQKRSETPNSNEPFRGFDCNSIQQQSPESSPLHRNISKATREDFQGFNNSTIENGKDFVFTLPRTPPPLKLKPGKSYRRSLLQIRNSTNHFSPADIHSPIKTPVFSFQERNTCVANTGGICTCAMCKRQSLEHLSPRRVSVRFMPVSPPTTEKSSTLQNYAAGICKGYNSDVFQESLLENYFENLSLTRENLEVTLEEPCREPTVTAREIVLRRCGQTEPLPFEKCYPNSLLQHCHKIGEGVYGEVFLFRNQNGGTTVMKIIPIEGDQIINGEKQKKFDEIISEIIIALELSNLRNGKKNNTAGFNQLYKICCVKGKYPERLLELWELYEEGHGTENDSPEIFTKEQLYIVLELANGGKDLEAFVFNNAQQAYAIFIQTACAIAVAETALQFEHRDLHWGNMLISNCDRSKKKVRCCIDGEEIELPTFGVEVAVIDFTLSRITHDGVCIYNDLSLDADLFTAKGDYQFDIYRLMKSSNGNHWQRFQPYTNVLWLHYILDKMITAVRYKNKKTRIHKQYLVKLEFLKQEILEYKSVKDIVINKFTVASAL